MGNAPGGVKSKREMFVERLRKKYPEKEYADDEAMFSQAYDDYDDYDNRIGQYEERERKMTDLLANNPSAAQFISDMASGKDPWSATIDRLGIDGITDLVNDPKKQEEYAAANKKYVERLAKERSLEEEYKKNISESIALIDKIQTERGIPDETMDAAMDLVMRMASEAIVGKFTAETVDMALNAVKYAGDIENARSEGVIAGKNAKIEERLRKPTEGDGQPSLSGSNNAPVKKRGGSMFDLADEAR